MYKFILVIIAITVLPSAVLAQTGEAKSFGVEDFPLLMELFTENRSNGGAVKQLTCDDRLVFLPNLERWEAIDIVAGLQRWNGVAAPEDRIFLDNVWRVDFGALYQPIVRGAQSVPRNFVVVNGLSDRVGREENKDWTPSPDEVFLSHAFVDQLTLTFQAYDGENLEGGNGGVSSEVEAFSSLKARF